MSQSEFFNRPCSLVVVILLSLFSSNLNSANATPLAARVWYVSQESNASDSNVGDRKSPLRTLSEALRRIDPGDVIFVGAGDYRDEDAGWGKGVFALDNFGNTSGYTRIMALPGTIPIVGKFLVKDCTNIFIKGFHIQGQSFSSLAPSWVPMPAIVRDQYSPDRPDYTQPYETRREQIEAEFETYFAIEQQLNFSSGVEVVNSTNVYIRANRIEGFWAGIQCRHCRRAVISQNIINETVNGIYAWQPAPSLEDSYIFLNMITQTLDQGINLRQGSDTVRVYTNTILYTGRNHIAIQEGAKNCSISANIGMFGGYYSENMEFPGSSGISFHSSLGGNFAAGNIVGNQVDATGIDGNGLILDLMEDGSTVRVVRNVFTGNQGSGINTTASPNSFLYGNVIASNRYGIKLSRNEDINQTILQNSFWRNVEAGIKSYRNIRNQLQINRNTYIDPASSLIWDDDIEGVRQYKSLIEIQNATPWERQGKHFVEGDE